MCANVIRVKPKAFDTDWRADLLAIGVKVPKTVPEIGYTPVNHDPMPFSIAIDLTTRCVVKRFVGVIPNATYNGKIYSWEEFCELLEGKGNRFSVWLETRSL